MMEPEKTPPEKAPFCPRLHFLELFIKSQKVTYEDIGKILGISRGAVCHMFRINDETRLSVVLTIVKALGYKLNITMSREKDETSGIVKVNIYDYLHLPPECVPDDLAFLSFAIKRYGICKRDLARKMGIVPTSLYRMFRVHDISIARLYQIASICKFDMRFEFTKEEGKNETVQQIADNPEMVKVITLVENEGVTYITPFSQKKVASGKEPCFED